MQQLIKKWGHGAAVRLPRPIMEQAHLVIDAAVDVRVEEDRIVIEPTRQKTYRLSDLVEGITSENRHGEVDTGAPVGKEAL